MSYHKDETEVTVGVEALKSTGLLSGPLGTSKQLAGGQVHSIDICCPWFLLSGICSANRVEYSSVQWGNLGRKGMIYPRKITLTWLNMTNSTVET